MSQLKPTMHTILSEMDFHLAYMCAFSFNSTRKKETTLRKGRWRPQWTICTENWTIYVQCINSNQISQRTIATK
jgi:hypothetical protein